jgi:NAD(P)-dependent dehydrogenase (short-subunit alcohol dehydrogenase family)
MIAIVTGGATGIGFGIARTLPAKGAQVACLEELPRSPAA